MKDMYIDVGGLLQQPAEGELSQEGIRLVVALLETAPHRVRLMRYDTDRAAFVLVPPEVFGALAQGETAAESIAGGEELRALSLDALRGDVFFDMDTECDLLPPRHVLYRDLKSVGAAVMVRLGDLQPLQKPWLCSPLRLVRFQFFFGAAMRYGDLLILNTADDCARVRELNKLLGMSCPACLAPGDGFDKKLRETVTWLLSRLD